MATFRNPLIPGFHPDPSVVRVGDEWYIATSTFEYLPGIPIHRSTDFEYWETVGHVAARPGQLAVENTPTGRGAWAPTLRHHDGLFHLVVTDAMGRGMLHFTAADAAGPWSDGDPFLSADGSAPLKGIDPDIAWAADGTTYITFSGLVLGGENHGGHLGIQQVQVDLGAHRALEEPRPLWSGTGGQFPEAPHLYEIEGTWYLMIAEGGTERGHSISIARGTSPEGPFEPAPHNPLLSARSTSRPVQNTGHGDLVIGPEGQWLCVMLGVRPRSKTRAFSALGRETFVTPVRWRDDGWPEIAPVEADPRPARRVEIDFAQPLDQEWIAVRTLPTELADLSSRPGSLVLHGAGATLDDEHPVFVGRRQEHLEQTVTVRLDVSRGVGGLAVRYDERFHVEIEAGRGRIVGRAVVGGLTQEWRFPLTATELDLRLDMGAPEYSGGSAPTSDVIRLAAGDAGTWMPLGEVDGRFLSSETVESYTGRVVGAYAVTGEVTVRSWIADGRDR